MFAIGYTDKTRCNKVTPSSVSAVSAVSALYHCPTCGSSIGGFKGIREDCQLQQIVNKVVPKLENLEAGRRKAFYEGSCKEDEGILEDDEKQDKYVP